MYSIRQDIPRVLINTRHSVNIIAFIATGLSYALLVSQMFTRGASHCPGSHSGQGGWTERFRNSQSLRPYAKNNRSRLSLA